MNNKPLRSYLQLHQQANEKVTPATFKRGIISAVNVHAMTADVQIVGNQSTVLKGIPLSSAINPATLSVGARCRIDMFSESNPNDCVVAYTY